MRNQVINHINAFGYNLSEATLTTILLRMQEAKTGGANKSAASREVWEKVSRELGLEIISEGGVINARTKKILLGITKIGDYHANEGNMNNVYRAWANPERYCSGGRRGGTEQRRNNAPAVQTSPVRVAPEQTDDDRMRAAWEMFRASVAPLMAVQEKNKLPYTFGVEIECGGDVTSTVIKDTLIRAGVNAYVTGYDHRDSDHSWKIGTDSSISGFSHMYEIVSPVLKGEEGMAELEKVCVVLDGLNIKTNSSCGLHVHIGAKDMKAEHIKNIVLNYAHAEGAMKKCSWYSRTGGRWSAKVSGYKNRLHNLDVAEIPQEYSNEAENTMRYIVNHIYTYQNNMGKRYHTVNLATYKHGHNTVEFRQHQATTDFVKISNWVYMLQALVAWSNDNYLLEDVNGFTDLPWANEHLKTYYTVRDIFNAAR